MASHQQAPRLYFLFSIQLVILSCITNMLVTAAQRSNSLDWVPFEVGQFDGNATLDTKGDVHLFWKLGAEYSTYGIASRSSGYLAVGFSETGAMTGADIALGYQNDAGKFVFENRHATGFVTPELSDDQQNNMRFQEGHQSSGVTGFIFEKKNNAGCLQTQRDVNTDSFQWFIYAFSDDNTFQQHQPGHNGKQYVKLGTGKSVSVNEARPVANVQNFTVMQPEITIPSEETTYCYTLHKLPAGKKNFILAEQPASSSNMLHHLVVYACYGLSDEQKDLVGKAPDCNWKNYSNPCNGFISEWAPGMSSRTFEQGYGKPFGSDHYEYVMLETHWNNPDGISGQKDSAGYTFFYNNKQVDTEIGTLTLGAAQVGGWFLEPGKEVAKHTTICTPDCTKQWPKEGITAVSVFHHMHLRGRTSYVQIIRDGKEIGMLSSLHNFDYGYQFSKSLNSVKLLPGDQLITTCEYDTTKDTEPVPGGQASSQEMCFAWVDYYPSNDVLVCSDYDMRKKATRTLNGTVGLCIKSDTSDSGLYNSKYITAPYQHLPASGNNCSATTAGDDNSSKTAPAPAASSSSFALSALSPLDFAYFMAKVILIIPVFQLGAW